MSIVSPDSEGAGLDACVAASNKKHGKYQGVLDELREEGLDYTPVVWTCWGRPGCAASTTVKALACAAARRRGIADPSVLENHVNAIIGCFIWKRAACMALACIGRQSREDVMGLLQPSADDDFTGDEHQPVPQLPEELATEGAARVLGGDACRFPAGIGDDAF